MKIKVKVFYGRRVISFHEWEGVTVKDIEHFAREQYPQATRMTFHPPIETAGEYGHRHYLALYGVKK